jgi:SAM-dependent methyltransferase
MKNGLTAWKKALHRDRVLTHQTSPKVVPESLKQETNPVSNNCLRGGYDPYFFDQLARIEDQHFWFRARNYLIFELARRVSSSLSACDLVLEVGCGTGNVLRVLEKACPNCTVVGLELWFEGLRLARSRSGAALVQADIRHSPFGRPFDLVGMFDVLEHLPEDRETLQLAYNSLRPGGKLLLTVPAHQSLWSYFDEAARHCRRYSAQDIREKLREAGFRVEFLSQFMTSIFPIVWIYRKMYGLRQDSDSATARAQASDELRLVPVINQLLTAVLTLEAGWVARGHRLPIGTSLVVVARRPA